MLGLWLDYSQGRPSGAAIKAAGAVGVMRYVGIGGGSAVPAKRLTAAELADLTGHDLIVLGAVESTTARSNGGRSLGIADGKAALADPTTRDLPVLFATNDQSGWGSANVAYVAGFQSVVGPERTGVYGFGSFLSACANDGLGSTYWQAGPSPSRTGTSGLAHFWQRNGTAGAASDGPATPTTRLVAGVRCDLNNQLREMTDVSLTDEDIQNNWAYKNVGAGDKGDMHAYLTSLIPTALDQVKMQLTALSGALSQDEAAILAAIKSSAGGSIDVGLLASQLAPLLNANEAQAFMAALKAQFEK